MYNNFTIDPSFHLATTPYEERPYEEFDALCDINASLDNVMDMSLPLVHDPQFDCDLPNLGPYPPHPIGSQCVMPSPVSLPPLTDCSSSSNKSAELGPGAGPRQQRSSEEHRASQANMQKVDRGIGNNKTKGNQRAHYAVEKRYRLSLNEKYAILTRTLSSEAVQRICRTDTPNGAPGQTDSSSAVSGGKDDSAGSGQRKTATLSMTIDTINVLSRCCTREAKELEKLQCSVNDIRNRVQQILEPKTDPGQEQSSGAAL